MPWGKDGDVLGCCTAPRGLRSSVAVPAMVWLCRCWWDDAHSCDWELVAHVVLSVLSCLHQARDGPAGLSESSPKEILSVTECC